MLCYLFSFLKTRLQRVVFVYPIMGVLHDSRTLQPNKWGYWITYCSITFIAGSGRFPGKQCTICFRFFNGYSTYMNHQAVHRGETTCPMCKFVFSQKQALKKHVLAKHHFTWDGNSPITLDQLIGARKTVWTVEVSLRSLCMCVYTYVCLA